MLDPDFIILRREGRTPSLAMCQKCKLKFFTPKEFTNKPDVAEEFLWGRFYEHRCRYTLIRPEKKAVNQ